MSAQPLCPYCGAKLFPHEVTNDECASCGGRLSGSVRWLPPVREEEPPRADAPPRLDQRLILPDRPPPEAFAALRQGISLVRWGVGLSMAFFAGLTILGRMVAAQEFYEDSRFFFTLILFNNVFQVVSAVVVILGVCFCCTVPKECETSRGKRFLLICMLATVPICLPAAAFFCVYAEFEGSRWPPSAAGAGPFILLAGVAGTISFFLLLADMARFFGDRRLADRLLRVCVLWLVAGASALLAQWLMPVSGYRSEFARWLLPGSDYTSEVFSMQEIASYMTVLTCVGLAIVFIPSVWLLFLLTRLHHLIPEPGDPQ